MVVTSEGRALGLGPRPGTRLGAALARSAAVPALALAEWGPAGSTGALLAVPLVDDALVRLDLARTRQRVLVVVDPGRLVRGRGRDRLATLADDALAADALVVLGSSAGSDARVVGLARDLARRAGAPTVVADLPGLDPTGLAAPDRDGRVPLPDRGR